MNDHQILRGVFCGIEWAADQEFSGANPWRLYIHRPDHLKRGFLTAVENATGHHITWCGERPSLGLARSIGLILNDCPEAALQSPEAVAHAACRVLSQMRAGWFYRVVSSIREKLARCIAPFDPDAA